MMNLDPLFGFLAAWIVLGLLNTGYALASGRRERSWLTIALMTGPLATSLLLVLTRGAQRVR